LSVDMANGWAAFERPLIYAIQFRQGMDNQSARLLLCRKPKRAGLRLRALRIRCFNCRVPTD
jgi:hypothetical protein